MVSLDGKIPYTLRNKVVDGKLYVDQGIIAGCAGGGFENICAAADILRGSQHRCRCLYFKRISGKYSDLYGAG